MAEKGKDQAPVKRAEIGEEFRVCPHCGYESGFHNMFRPSGDPELLDWFFICPGCATQWDVGLKVKRT
jgi:hypothetical protein